MAEHNESICRNCFHSYVCERFNENKDDSNKKCHFANDHYIPRADVVLKSEVEILKAEIRGYSVAKKYDAEHFMADIRKLQEENNTLIKNQDKLLRCYTEKIFEEIEWLIANECLVFKDEDGIRGYVDASVHYAIAELKKKYTEGGE